MLRMATDAIGKAVLMVLLTVPLLAGAGGSWGCGREYSQATPDDVLRSARAMVENGDTHRLPDLLYADSPEMRRLMTQFGKVLGSLQALAIDLHRTFPDEVAQIRAEAEEAAKRGDASGFLGRIVGAQTSQGRGAGRRGSRSASPSGSGDARQSFDQAMKELFADPYGWLERSEGRITTQYVADDLSAIMWDEKPVFGIGLLMKKEGSKWYIVLPTGMPGVGRLAPMSEDMWQIGGALAQALDNAIRDTQREVRSGQHASMEDLWRSVGEKAAIPALAITYAYQRAAQIERREQREREQQSREERQSATSVPPGGS